MKTYVLSFFLAGMSLYLNAQNWAYAPSAARSYGGNYYVSNSNDPEDKDISIMTGILSKLVQQEFNNGDTTINVESVKGSYIPGSGILFTVTQRMPFYNRPMLLGVNGRAVYPSRYGLTTTGAGQISDVMVVETPKVASTGRAKNTPKLSTAGGQLPFATTVVPDIALLGDSVGVQVINGQVYYSSNGSMILNQNINSKSQTAKLQDSVFAAKVPRMKKVLEKFLAEYTILLSKLKPEEKIWATWTIKEDSWGYDQGRTACELSSRIVKQDMLDLRAGKLDQAKFAERIQYTITQCATPQVVNPEVEVFTAILERLYAPGISQNLVLYPGVKGSVIGGFGYNFTLNLMPHELNTFSALQLDPASGSFKAQPQKENSKEEIEKKVKAFKAEFPGQLLEYSRIIKGLKTGEILKIDVTLGNGSGALWTGGEVSRWSYTLPQSLIRDYDAGKLKLEDAVKLIQVEEK